MASNVEATKKAYESFQRGDIPALISNTTRAAMAVTVKRLI